MGKAFLSAEKKLDIVVLMAGEGKRLRPHTADRPKALLCCNDGLSIFHHTISAFADEELDLTIIPVIGHGAKKVYEEIDKLNHLAKFDCAYNPFYDAAGPSVSLWLGVQQSSNENVLVVNGDTIFRNAFAKKVTNWINDKTVTDEPVAGLCVSHTSNFQPDDMKVSLDHSGLFNEVGKQIKSNDGCVKSSGAFCVKGLNSKQALKKKLEELIMNKDSLGMKYHWHNIVNEIKENCNIELIDVDIKSWQEMDTPAELEIVRIQQQEQA